MHYCYFCRKQRQKKIYFKSQKNKNRYNPKGAKKSKQEYNGMNIPCTEKKYCQ